jgi:transposase
MDEEEAAVKFGVGVSTIKTWYTLKKLDGFKIKDRLYFLRTVKDPREKDDKND